MIPGKLQMFLKDQEQKESWQRDVLTMVSFTKVELPLILLSNDSP